MFGVRQTAQSRFNLSGKMRGRDGYATRVKKKGDSHALDDFCCAAYSVVIGFQSAYSWQSDSPASGGRVDSAGH